MTQTINSQPHSNFQQTLGYSLTEWTSGHAVVVQEVTAKLMNRSDMVHGAVYMALIDSAGGYAGTYYGPDDPERRCVSVNVSTNFLAPVREGVLTATAQRYGGGTTIFFSRVEVHDQTGNLVATGEGIYRMIRVR